MTESPLPLVELFGKPDCHLCEEAKALLKTLQSEHAFTLREWNIAEHQALLAQYGEEVPVVCIDGRKAFKYRVNPRQFIRRLHRARDYQSRALRKRLWPR